MIEAELPDGRILEFPVGTSPDVIQKAVKGMLAPKEQPGKLSSLGAGIGQGVGNVVLGAQNLLGMGLEKIGADTAGQWLQQDAQQGKAKLAQEVAPYEQANPMTTGGGRLAGEIVSTLPVGGVLAKGVAAIPGVATKTAPLVQALRTSGMSAGGLTGAKGLATRAGGGAVVGGTSASLINQEDTTPGAIIGGAFPVLAKGAGVVGQSIGQNLRPAADPLAQRAMQMGAPLGIADLAEGKTVKALRSILNDAPMSGGIGAKQNDAKQAWFNKAVGEVFDASSDKLTPEVMDAAKKRMGGEFDRIWGNNVLKVDDAFVQSLDKAKKNASMLPEGERNRIIGMVDDLASQIKNGEIPGDVANRYQSEIRKMSEKANGFLKDDLTNLRRDVLSAFNRSVSPEDATALALNQKKYKAFKTVEPLLAKGEAGVAGREAGDIPAGLLPQAVYQQYGSNVAGSPLADLSRIGSKYLVDRTPQTGGSARAMIQNSAIGGALAAGSIANPATLAAIPTAMAVNKALGSPRLARSLAPTKQNAALINALRQIEQLGYRSAPVIAAD